VNKMLVRKINDKAKLPTKGHSSDAAFDFYTPSYRLIEPGETVEIRLGLQIALPEGYALIFKEKSGIASRSNLRLKAGVIDCSYRGELIVVYSNEGSREFYFDEGEKAVQGIVIEIPEFEVQEVADLDYTDRNSNGFGSTGRF